jgi:hypothetical protein
MFANLDLVRSIYADSVRRLAEALAYRLSSWAGWSN